MEGITEISTAVVRQQAIAGARLLVSALREINSSSEAEELPPPFVEPETFEHAFAMLYVEFVGRWSVIRA